MPQTLYAVSELESFVQIIATRHDFKRFCDHLGGYVFKKYRRRIIDDILNRHYYYLFPSEQMFIGDRIAYVLDSVACIEYISSQLMHCFEEYSRIDLDGFAAFRLGRLADLIEMTADKAVVEYLDRLRMDELLESLKNCVCNKKPYTNSINLLSYNNRYTLYDNRLNVICEIVSCDELLLDVLITLAPDNIFLYGKIQSYELLNAVFTIFENRILLK